MFRTLRQHWPEYLIEASGVGLMMISACGWAMLLVHPASPVATFMPSFAIRRLLLGLAAGITGMALVYSPWGKQSGAHFNPATTLTFWRLGRVPPLDALAYIVAQCLGGTLGVAGMAALFYNALAHPTVHFVSTVPGPLGTGAAWGVEFAVALALMMVILTVSNTPAIARWTGVCVGLLVAVNIGVVASLVGSVSANPARTLASAIPSGTWAALWVYLTAPCCGMLAAAQLYVWLRGRNAVFCAKLHHQNGRRCIFCESRARAGNRKDTTASNMVNSTTTTLVPTAMQECQPCPPTSNGT